MCCPPHDFLFMHPSHVELLRTGSFPTVVREVPTKSSICANTFQHVLFIYTNNFISISYTATLLTPSFRNCLFAYQLVLNTSSKMLYYHSFAPKSLKKMLQKIENWLSNKNLKLNVGPGQSPGGGLSFSQLTPFPVFYFLA